MSGLGFLVLLLAGCDTQGKDPRAVLVADLLECHPHAGQNTELAPLPAGCR